MTKRLLIVGTGGYTKEVGQIARRIDPDRVRWNPISYVAMSAGESPAVATWYSKGWNR